MQSSTPFKNDDWRYDSYEHNSTSDFQQESAPMLIVAFDSEECGSGAASSSKGSGAASFSKTYNSHDQTQ
jgi:hypothetical protein